ncbi:MAG: RNA polymerase sigma factor [Methylomicrobium sp.]|nr:RNA polymerase sigma factor [Methylomicrobium sp.]
MKATETGFLHTLFLNYAKEMGTFISLRWPREDDVCDIVQESFLRLSLLPQPQSINNPRAFLFQTATNIVIDKHRKQVSRKHYDESDQLSETTVESSNAGPDRLYAAQQSLSLFKKWLGELPELQRHAFILYRVEGYPHPEIAKRLGISIRTSERYVNLALQHISARMSNELI